MCGLSPIWHKLEHLGAALVASTVVSAQEVVDALVKQVADLRAKITQLTARKE